MQRDTLLQIILLISFIGLIVAGYQTYEHYAPVSSVCDINEQFSCSVVTESRYGEFPQQSGIALSAWGILWWVSVILLSYTLLQGREFLENQEFYLFADFGFGVLTALYLIAVELYWLPQETGEVVICPLCTVQHALIAALIVIGYFLLEKPIRAYIEDIFYMEA